MFIAETQTHLNVGKQTEYIVTRLLQLKPGSFHRIRYQRPLKFRKTFEESNFGFKETEGIFRFAINYDNIGDVKDKRADGSLPEENAGLPPNLIWLVPPRLLKNIKTDRIFARVYTVRGQVPKVSYTLNGQPVEKDSLKELCLASEFAEKKEIDCFTLDVENILEIS